MRLTEIQLGKRYVIKEWSKPVAMVGPAGCAWLGATPGVGFPGYWKCWEAEAIVRQGQRVIVEWQEPVALHRIPEVPMRWGTRTVRRAVKPSQLVREAT